jgi:tetratricopeptide (TPR) repeat protein
MSRRELVDAMAAWLWETTGARYDLDVRLLAKWERGEVRWPAAHYRSALRAVLHVATDAELGFAPASRAAEQERLRPADASGVEPWELTDMLTCSAISPAALDHMERATNDYAAAYPWTPPDTLLPKVSGQLQRLQGALTRPQPLRERRRAVVLLGVLAGLSGNLWLDLGRASTSARYFDVGELAAEEADAPDLAAWLLANRSIGPFFAGDYLEAADLLARAEELAAVHSSARRRAWVAALHARAEAAAGRSEECRRALDRAYVALADSTEPPGGADFFDAPRLDGLAGTTHLALGDTEQAAPLLRAALARRAVGDTKGRALVTLDLAECLAVDSEPKEAARLAMSALRSATGARVGPIVARARGVRARLAPWARERAVAELDGHVKELTGG